MKKLTVLVSSCDDFSDCWEPYCHGLKKYWHDCPYDVFIITNYKDFTDGCAKSLKVGEDKGWGHNTIKALRQINTPYVLYTHEDFWIKRAVDTKIIEDYIAIMEQDKADYIRLFPCPPPDTDFPDDWRVGIIDQNSSYRSSLQVALWRKSVFENLIVPDENPWQFEIYGTIRSRKYDKRFLCVKKFVGEKSQPFHYGVDYVCTAINKGLWSKAAKSYAREEGIRIDFSNRPNENWWHDFIRSGRLGQFCGNIGNFVVQVAQNPQKVWRKIQIGLQSFYR